MESRLKHAQESLQVKEYKIRDDQIKIQALKTELQEMKDAADNTSAQIEESEQRCLRLEDEANQARELVEQLN